MLRPFCFEYDRKFKSKSFLLFSGKYTTRCKVATKSVKEEVCPIVNSIELIGSKWKLIVIRYLSESPMGFNELLKRIRSSNSKELSLTLKQLQDVGIVERRIVSYQPFRVQYALTQKGEELKPVLEELRKWGEKWALPNNQSENKSKESENEGKE
ncbi:hypothetical protein B9Q01_04865 [Candidatus Marsarchaeota G1 archaeon OSP_D]|uniref:HTH hxlR-type domain-containing protein n=2 Tax=Candidatus Marsarchaeota group 1 TaxID=2203770 RepID=A0A2R6AAM7_9ARCH|nr:MAG: hypothetical protein B9Q01_04865 [Candidatus Marsarchaeota G1 archaeon OSP_D]PSN88203.1 MAG: hypothetical protein B9Q00_06405 [Candidatus Marsarchaeota G1 archaeon OSP_C]